MSSKRRSNPWGWIFVLILIAAGFFGWRWYRGRAKETAIDYKTSTVNVGDIVQAVTANGQINAVKSVAVGSQVSGIITDIRADFNSRVTNGQVVAQIDPSTYQQNITQAEAELSNAMAALELAQVNWKRAQALRTNGLIPEADYDQALANLHQGEAVVKTRQASLNKAKVDLERTTIYAPIDGVVISRVVDVGQTVAASFNAPTLFTIANDLRQMRIEAMVSEADVGGVEEGQQVTFTVDAFPGRRFRGEVTQVRYAPITNQNVVNYTAVVEVNNSDLKLRPGMTANATLIVAEHKNVPRIPNAALRFRPPTGAIIEGETNAPASGKVELATSGPFAGLPIPPWQAKGERRRPTDEERAAYEASLTPEQKQKYQEVIAAMRARFAQREGGGGGGGGEGGSGEPRPRRAEPSGPRTQTVYLLEKSTSKTGERRDVLKPVTVRVGISDGSNTEVLEGLKEGDVVLTGTVSATAESTAPVSPFGNPFGGPRRR